MACFIPCVDVTAGKFLLSELKWKSSSLSILVSGVFAAAGFLAGDLLASVFLASVFLAVVLLIFCIGITQFAKQMTKAELKEVVFREFKN